MKKFIGSLRPLLLFQKRIIPPALGISTLLGILIFQKPWGIGLVFMFLAPLWHYYTYEIRSKAEYVFYFNLGFTRLSLWLATLGVALCSALLCSLI